MPSTCRRQRRYDHRLRDLVQRTGDLTNATDLGVPRSTARGWMVAAPRVVVSVEVADLTEPELRHEILKLRRRVEKLAALLRLALALLHASGFSLSRGRLPDGQDKLRGPTVGTASMWVAELCYAQARVGDRRGAALHLSELTARATTEYISPYDLAIACVGVGENDVALDYLDDAYAQRVMRLLGLGDPEFDGISREPRYQRLLGSLGLPRAG